MENVRVIAPLARQPRFAALARLLVLRQLGALEEGELLVKEPGQPDAKLGDGDSSFPLAELHVHNASTWKDLLTGGGIGAAEAFVAGDWDSPDLVALLRFFARNVDRLNAFEDRFSWISKPLLRGLHRLNRNSKDGSRKNIAAHYDLGNELFETFLDDSMMYSSALYPSADATLEEAARHKLDGICQTLELRPGDRVVEIGTGWGGFAIHAARHYGCHVTTTTISAEQLELARERVRAEGLEDRVTLLFDDYRDLSGRFDKLVSIEMIEAVGPEYLDGYLAKVSQLLKPEGQALIQAINLPEQRYHRALHNVDFIQRYIFPGSFIPSFGALLASLRQHTDLVLSSVDDLGFHYARTLRDWRHRFNANSQRLESLGYDKRFQRLWQFYFAYCEAGFAERAVGVSQVLLCKPRHKGAVYGHYEAR
ncbi:MAG: cyclopropane-fatty-acyl-phospholipid synthase family protein [Marinobacter sp.]|uniref:cyclopropane-fatty-acyl-phospholipid synthase family protein n=1 Tax=Marinobacter sp. TaxID=50741 RepID=UPI00299E3D38|nr:cyclopropane-fatty-acyl-phospholipid synthase family protein [Marinobacter sp.]MDX1755013.1 cyclopropane-fatty-acyl-phospholipid synthase family protein [Marinobacter sp.]